MNKGGPARDIRANGPAPAGPVKKLDRRTRKGLMLRLGGYILQYWPLFLLAVLLTLASNQLSLMGPKYSGDAIDAIAAESGVNFDAVWENVGRMLVCYAASAILSYLLAILMIRLSQRIVYTMRKQLFEKLTSLPVSYFDTHTTGDIISRISYDIDTVNASLSQDLVQVMTSISHRHRFAGLYVADFPAADCRVRHHGAGLDFLHAVPLQTRAAPVPYAFPKARRAQRLRGGDAVRRLDHPRLRT